VCLAAGLVTASRFGVRTARCVAATFTFVGAARRGRDDVSALRGAGRGSTDGPAAVLAFVVGPEFRPGVATSGRPRATAAITASAATPTKAHRRRPRRVTCAAPAACCPAGRGASSYRVERPSPTGTSRPAETSSDNSDAAWEPPTPVRRS
jgi:hypothetical protein